jgi:hypothetical protein
VKDQSKELAGCQSQGIKGGHTGRSAMKKNSRYVFGAALAGMALGGVHGMVSRAHAATITAAAFTFENDISFFPSSGTSSTFTLFASFTGASVGPILADSGTGSAFGIHSSSSTVYSTPVGNGSAKSFSANHWLSGDDYEFDVPTTGLNNILVSFDQTSSSTGPKVFLFEYTAGAASGSTAYTVGTTSFAASTVNPAVNFSFNLSAITGVNNVSNVDFKLVDNDTTTATGGTDRVDNFIVSGTSVPEPAGLALIATSALALVRRRNPR